MEIYTLDDNYREMGIVDEYESFIWTERYASHGDFEIVAPNEQSIKDKLHPGTLITHNESKRAMVVEESLIAKDSEGAVKLNVSGRSLEFDILDARAIGPNRDGAELTVRGTPAWVVARLVNKICVNGEDIYELDKIPGMSVRNNITGGDNVDHALKQDSLYNVVKELCDSDDLGFKIEYATGGGLNFEVYRGVDRPDVAFSSKLDNLSDETYLQSHGNFKNTAYVWAGTNTRSTIYAKGWNATRAVGRNRRILTVVASDIDPNKYTTQGLRDAMKARGEQELAKHKILSVFDGKLTPNNPYKYGDHYHLGDVVTLMGDGKEKRKNVVTEYIWAHDQEGQRSYPTFTAKE